MASDLTDKFLFVAAIDFGTAYSGYAFSSIDDFSKDPLKVCLNTWSGATLLSQKTPTCVLFDPKKKFYSFGFEAEDKYSDLASDPDEDHKKWYFFRRFKMSLFDKMKLKRKFMLEDVVGKKIAASEVFCASIKFLKDHLEKRCRDMLPSLTSSEIRWVLTVPAIWNDSSKQFMREAAEKAGINGNSLLIALEPEAASLCCKYLPVETFAGCSSGFVPFQSGSKYMVFDAGGGTVDITVHEVLDKGVLKELFKANGGNWGGTFVDLSFRNLLADIVGNDVMDDFAENDTGDYIDLFREFEVKKRNFRNRMDEKVMIKIPIKLPEKFKDHRGKSIGEVLEDKPAYKGKVSWTADKLRMDPATAKRVFKDACDNIVQHLKSLFRDDKIKDVPTILMVGGFSESPLLQELMKEEFKHKKIIIPADPGVAVLKGAVIYGHDPSVIQERRCRYTYGVQTSMPFRDGVDREENKFKDDSEEYYCNKRFGKHVEVGQAVVVGESQCTKSYSPTKKDQKEIKFLFYATTEVDPTYTTDKGCINIGDLTIQLDGYGLDRSVSVRMIFSGTELMAEAEQMATTKGGKADNKVKCVLNFLG